MIMKKLNILLHVFAVAFSLSPLTVAGMDTPLSLRSERKTGQVDRVEVSLEVGGETLFTEEGKTKREKMSVACKLEYFEKTLATPADGAWRAIRDYQKVTADVKVGDGQFKPTLNPEHHLIAVEATPSSALLFSPQGRLTRDELDAIDIQASSLLLDRLLPDKPVSVGDRWEHSPDTMAAILGLDEIAKTTVTSELKEVNDTVARFEFSGNIEGAIYGVSTKIEVKGRYRFDLHSKRVDWIGLLTKEVRSNSFVADGVDVVSKVAVLLTPAQEPATLADAVLKKLTLKSSPELTSLTFEVPSGQWQCPYDRRWYIHHQRPKIDVAVLRMVDRGTLTGQCNVSSLPQRKREDLVSLEDYQKDVRKALGKSFGEFVEAKQSINDANCRVYRVVVEGTDAEIPMRWVYYLIADPQGRQVAMTFAVERKLVEQFAEADKAMVQSLRFSDIAGKTNDQKATANSEISGKKG